MPGRLVETIALPSGTRITRAQLVGAGPLLVGGYIPGNIAEVAGFFTSQLVRGGFSLSRAHADDVRAGSRIEGNGLEGRWEVATLPSCPGVVSLVISVVEP